MIFLIHNILYKIINNKKIKMILIIILFLIISVFTFFLSSNGILSNDVIIFSIILLVFGILLFIYSIIYSIKYKKINYFIFTPIVIILFIIIGTKFSQIKYNRIYKIADYISQNYNENIDNNFVEILNSIKIPRKMQIIIENNEIIIIYKDLIYFVNKARFLDVEYYKEFIEDGNINIKN